MITLFLFFIAQVHFFWSHHCLNLLILSLIILETYHLHIFTAPLTCWCFKKYFIKSRLFCFIVHVMVNVTRINTINFVINFSYIWLYHYWPLYEMKWFHSLSQIGFNTQSCNYHLWKKIVFLENRNLNQCRKLFLTIDIAFHLRSILSMTLAIGKDFPRISRATY